MKEIEEKARREYRIELVRNCHKNNVAIERIAVLIGITEKEVFDIIAEL
jgi:hypothetical protein